MQSFKPEWSKILTAWCNGVGGGVQGCKRTHKSFDLSKIRTEMAPNAVWFQKLTPEVCRKIHEDLFFFFLQKICKQKSHKNCSGNFGEIQAKSFAPPKIRLLLRHGRNDQKLDLFCFRVYHFRYRNSILFNRKSAFCFRFCSQWKNSKRQLAVCTSKWYKNSKWRVLLYMAKRYG